MTHFTVIYLDHNNNSKELGVYAATRNEAAFVAVESHPYLHRFPGSIVHIIEER